MGRHLDSSEKSEKIVYKPKSTGTKRRRSDSVGRSVYKKTPHFSSENELPDGNDAFNNESELTEKAKNAQSGESNKLPEAAEKAQPQREKEKKAKKTKAEKTPKIKKEKKIREDKNKKETDEILPDLIDKEENQEAVVSENVKIEENPKAPQPDEKSKIKENSKPAEKSDKKKPQMPFFFPLTLTVLAAVLVWGLLGNGWGVSWTLFFLIPVIYSAQNAVKNRNANDFSFFALTLFVYCFIGLEFGAWHPYWLIFAAVPIYHIIVSLIKKAVSKQKIGSADGEENTENQK